MLARISTVKGLMLHTPDGSIPPTILWIFSILCLQLQKDHYHRHLLLLPATKSITSNYQKLQQLKPAINSQAKAQARAQARARTKAYTQAAAPSNQSSFR